MGTGQTPLIVGLTGGIASGKSTVAKLFQEKGIPVLDADKVARGLSEPGGKAAPLIQARFGTLDRLALRQKIVEDPKAKKDLETILHPLIRLESQLAFTKMAQENPDALCLVYEAALLIEAGRAADFHELIVVTAPIEDRIRRLMARDNCDRNFAEAIIAAQISDEERKDHATRIIENNSDQQHLAQAVVVIIQSWKKSAKMS